MKKLSSKQLHSIGVRILSIVFVGIMVMSAMVVFPSHSEAAPPVDAEKPDALATHVVISEVQNDCTGTENNEFIELYNPTGGDISLVGWDILYSSSSFSSWTSKYTIVAGDANGGVIPAHGFYLIGEEGGTNDVFIVFGVHVDNLANPGLNLGMGTNSHVGIRDAGDVLIDHVGQGTATNPETTATPQAPTGQSIERKSGATHNETEGNGWDTDNNFNDFVVRTIPEPQNSQSLPESGGGDTDPPELWYAISTSPTDIEAHFNEPVNQSDVETLANWKIVNLAGFDTIAPYITQCIATSTTSVEVTFSEAVNAADANNVLNYEMVTGLPITNAVLDAELTTVNLTTNPQTIDQTYTLLVSWINDTAVPPNVIEQYSEATFNGGGGGGNLKIIFIDVEQGDSTLIISPTGQSMLFDGGDTGTGAHILSVLSANGITDLKYIVASHYHEDHIGAFDEVITGLGGMSHVTGGAFDRGSSYSSTPYDEYEAAVFTNRMTLYKNDVLDLGGGVTATCVAVNGNGLSPSNENDKGVVMRLDYQNFQMALTGDLAGYTNGDYTDIESSVASDMGQVEVYQVGHHGSQYSSNPVFLAEMDPLAAILSVGSNSYGHVSQAAYDRINAQGSYMYYTNPGVAALPVAGEGEIVNGDVVLNTDGSQFDIEGDVYQCHSLIDSEAPTVIDARATDLTHVELTFSETVNTGDAQTLINYDIDGGIGPNPSGAVLQPDLRTVNLTTLPQTEGITYNITINDIRDRAPVPNTIMADTMVSFTGGRPTLEILTATIDPVDDSIVHLTTDIQSRVGYKLIAYNIRDSIPNLQPETSVNFVGGGYHMTINEIYYDDSGADDDREWWEIYNPEATAINIKSWKFADDSVFFGLPSDDLVVPTGGHATMALNGFEFRNMYGYYPDFEVYGSTESKDMSYSGSSRSILGNTGDYLEMQTATSKVYDAVAWGNSDYVSIAPNTAPDVSSGSSLERTVPGREGPEAVLSVSPTGADESSEQQNLGDFHQQSTPNPETLDELPPEISNVHWDIGSVFSVIYWDTTDTGWPEINPEGDTMVVYSTNPNPDAGVNSTAYSADMVTQHGIMLYPLTPTTTYYFYVQSTDGIGQTQVDKNGGSFYQFTTGPSDATAPIISNVQVTVTDTTAEITWQTDEIASGSVNFDTDMTLDYIQTNLHLTQNHSIMLYDLNPSTSYYFSVSSKNPSGLNTIDDNGGLNYQFTTTAPDTLNYYWGNMDSFTGYSSGILTPNDAYTYANGGPGSPGTDHLVISEVYFNPVGADDETSTFVELYNPTSSPITFTAGDPWYVKHINGLNDAELWSATLDSGTIPAHGFFLIGGSSLAYDILKPGSLQNGPDSVRLEHPAGTYIDVVGYDGTGTGTSFDGPENYETFPVPQLTEGTSAERKSGSVHVESEGNQQDLNDNSADFYERGTPQPQNSGSPIEIPPIGTGPDIDFLGINDYSINLDAGEWADGQVQEAAHTVNGDFIAMYGQQLASGEEGYGQISAYNSTPDELASGNPLVNLTDAYQWVMDHDATGIFNAPGYRGTFDDMAYNESADAYMKACEILGGYLYFDYEYYFNLGLRNGWHYGALGGQRNNNGNWGNKLNGYGKIDMTMIKAPDLTTASVENALNTMNFYAFEADTPSPSADPPLEDPIYLNFSVNGYEMGQSFTDSNDLEFKIDLDAFNPFYKVELLEDGAVIGTWSSNPTSSLDWIYTYTTTPGHHYYYVRGNQTDSQNSNFWSTPIWIYKPALSLPDDRPVISDVAHSPNTPMSTDDVTFTADVYDPESALSVVYLWYSVDGGPYTNVEMLDDGVGADVSAGDGIFTYLMSAMVNGTDIHYYVDARDDSGQITKDQPGAPAIFYSFYVGPRMLINEVYANALDITPVNGQESQFVEFWNPLGVAESIENWTIECTRYYDKWAWPTGASIGADAYVVLARDSYYDVGPVGGYRDDPELTEPGEQNPPLFEMFDGSDRYDDPASTNMVLVEGNSEMKMSDTYDALILKNQLGTIMDTVEWGQDFPEIPGDPIDAAPAETSLTRNFLHTDVDSTYADFSVLANPTPGLTVSIPTISDVQMSPTVPNDTDIVTISAKIVNDNIPPIAITATLYYSLDGGVTYPFTVGMIDMGSNIFEGDIPAQPASTTVMYYVYASAAGIATAPYNAPTGGNYTYTVWPHLVISEVYYNSIVDTDGTHQSKFIEIYNPTAGMIDLNGWLLQGEPTWWLRTWVFPNDPAAQLASMDTLVVAKTAGDAGTDGFFTEFGFLPDFEMYDPTVDTGIDPDNPAVPNLTPEVNDAYDGQLELGGPIYYDAVYLKTPAGIMIDAMEYGIEGESVPGSPAVETEVGQSLSRDEFGTDTDNSLVDFTPGTPSPGSMPTPQTPYNIPIVDPTNSFPAWRFISFPKAMSGPVVTVLDDSIYGDGNTIWDIVEWYDPATGWKSYNAAVPGLSVMPDLDETMGLWVRITANGGDNFLTTGITGPDTNGGTINLQAGWNLVGYPSSTPRQADTTLPVEVTKIAVYNSSRTYLIEDVALSSVTMTEGNAYWVYATAATTWVVAA